METCVQMDKGIGYAACLRGLNVGGRNRVAMADLRDVFLQVGASQVRTYIQSGNVIFRSSLDEVALASTLEAAFAGRFGFASPVLLRTGNQLRRIIENCPFSEAERQDAESGSEVEHLHVALLGTEPLPEAASRLQGYAGPLEKLVVMGCEAYLLLHHGIHHSKVAANLHRLGDSVTLRNWNTMKKLAEMVSEMETD